MTFDKAKDVGTRLFTRVKRLPLPLSIMLAAIPIAGIIGFMVSGTQSGYVALYDGLPPSEGGVVIAALQKDGIPYRLSQNGNVISVPASDLGKARLELGAAGQPNRASSADWRALEHASMTTSHAAVRALRLQALQSSLEQTIETMSGARSVRVMIAVPRSTPFLADQPEAKASVVLTGAPQADYALGSAVASIVAHGVTGLDEHNVVVGTSRGKILFPKTSRDNADQELAIQARIEASQEAKVRSLLVPVLGAGNFRIAVSANVSFARKKIENVSYGPKSYPVSQDVKKRSRIGQNQQPIGIPGALSNQPPGPTVAPVGKKTKATAKASKTVLPQSKSSHETQSFAIDQTRTDERPSGWEVKGIDVSVVVNKAAMKGITSSQIQKMIASANAVPGSSVNVTEASFVRPGQLPIARPRPRLSRIIQAVLIILAAGSLLLGLILPVVRWLRRLPEDDVQEQSSDDTDMPPLPTPSDNPFAAAKDQVATVTQTNPAAVARVLEKWASSGK